MTIWRRLQFPKAFLKLMFQFFLLPIQRVPEVLYKWWEFQIQDLKSETTGFCKLVFLCCKKFKNEPNIWLRFRTRCHSKYMLSALFCYSFFVCLAQNKFSGVVWVQLTACSVFGFDFFSGLAGHKYNKGSLHAESKYQIQSQKWILLDGVILSCLLL